MEINAYRRQFVAITGGDPKGQFKLYFNGFIVPDTLTSKEYRRDFDYTLPWVTEAMLRTLFGDTESCECYMNQEPSVCTNVGVLYPFPLEMTMGSAPRIKAPGHDPLCGYTTKELQFTRSSRK